MELQAHGLPQSRPPTPTPRLRAPQQTSPFLYPDAKTRGLKIRFSEALGSGCLGLQNVNTLVEVGQLGDSRLGALGEWENEGYRAVGSRQTGWRIARGRGRSQD